jgi:hypothetical protein
LPRAFVPGSRRGAHDSQDRRLPAAVDGDHACRGRGRALMRVWVTAQVSGAACVEDAVAAGLPGFLGSPDAVAAGLQQEAAHRRVTARGTGERRRVGTLLGDLVGRPVVSHSYGRSPRALIRDQAGRAGRTQLTAVRRVRAARGAWGESEVIHRQPAASNQGQGDSQSRHLEKRCGPLHVRVSSPNKRSHVLEPFFVSMGEARASVRGHRYGSSSPILKSGR